MAVSVGDGSGAGVSEGDGSGVFVVVSLGVGVKVGVNVGVSVGVSEGVLVAGEEPFELAKACDCLVVIGASCGTFIEMIATKWMQGPPVYAVSSLLTAIPAEILAEIDVAFFESLDRLEEALGHLNQ